MASNMTEATMSLRPTEAHRVANRIAPNRPTPIRKLVASSIGPSTLESMKNKGISLSDAKAAAKFRASYAGLTRVSIYLHKMQYTKMMDCRVKPGNDEKTAHSTERRGEGIPSPPPNQKPPHDTPSPAFQPRDLPLG